MSIGGTSAFLDLTDTPSDYSGHEDELIGVNHAATALEHKNVVVLSNSLGLNVDNMGLGLGGGQTGGHGQVLLYGRDYTGTLTGSVDISASNAGESGMALALRIFGDTNTPSVDIQHILKTNTIAERTTGYGVTIDGCLIKDHDLMLGSGYARIRSTGSNAIRVMNTAGTGTGILQADKVIVDSYLQGDDIQELSAGASVSFPDYLKTDQIGEKTANAGVTVDGCLIKNGVAGSGETEKLFVPPGAGFHAHPMFGGAGVAKLGDANNYPTLEFEHTEVQRGSFSFIVPQDYASGGTLKIVYLDHGSGSNYNVVLSIYANSRAVNENHTSGNSTDVNNVITIYADDQVRNWSASGVSLTYEKGDYVGVKLKRETGHASDTAPYALRVVGIQFEYTKG
jgi:hypothetical protein